jgi:predicted ATPase
MLKRLHVKGFKSIEDLAVEFSPLVVIFGPNAAGKSNLLDAQMLLSRIATERTLADAFSWPLRGYPAEAFTLARQGLEGLLAQPEAVLSLEAVVGSKSPGTENGPDLLYRIGIRIKPSTGALSVVEEHLDRLKRNGTPAIAPRIERSGEALVIRRLNESGQPRKEQIGLNHALVSNLQFTGPKYPDLDRLRAELRGWQIYYLDPRVAMREAQPPREVTDIGPLGQWLAPFLFRLKETRDLAPRFDAIRRALHAAVPAIESLDVTLDPARGTLDIQVVQDGVPFSSRVISEGTLRVLALCAIAANPWPGSLVAFEEPENGVHPRRIAVIADLLGSVAEGGKTQVIVTTHSPTLVAAMVRKQRKHPRLVTILACHREGRATVIRPFGTAGELFDDPEIQKALQDRAEDGLIESMLLRGWTDG